MNVLFIHQNFPGQFKHLAKSLADRGDKVVALCIENRPVPPGIAVLRYKPQRSNTPNLHPWLLDTETKLIRGEACFQAMLHLKKSGFQPDIVCAHPGWGEALFAKDVWPDTPLLSFFEFYYRTRDSDIDFDPEFPSNPLNAPRVRAKNFVNLMNLELCDAGISPTEWQKNQHPNTYHHKIRVIHDGIDTDTVKPDPSALFDPLGLGARDEVVTFINRNLEPYRGYHIFMRSLPKILRERPKARVVIVGEDGVSYGARPAEGTWRARFFEEVKNELDTSRVHFTGRLSYADLIRLMQVSAVHVYLTYPFVLSWSMLEAMSAGCLIVGSDTPPVREVIRHGENGLLVDFFSPSGIADQVIAALSAPSDFAEIRQNARQTVLETYDCFRICLPRQIAYLDQLRGMSSTMV